MLKVNLENFVTGYFTSLDRPYTGTKTHMWDKNTQQTLCGYKPAKKMLFQWCNNDYRSGLHLQCPICVKRQKKNL